MQLCMTGIVSSHFVNIMQSLGNVGKYEYQGQMCGTSRKGIHPPEMLKRKMPRTDLAAKEAAAAERIRAARRSLRR